MATLRFIKFLGGVSTYRNVYGINWFAQTFTTPQNLTLTKVSLYLSKNGSPSGNFNVSIRATSEGLPTGSDLASTSVSASSITSGWNDFTLNYNLTGGTVYAIVFSCPSGDASNYIMAYDYETSSLYSGGQYCYSTNSGSSWNYSPKYDFNFRISGTIATDSNPKEDKEFEFSTDSLYYRSIYGTDYKAGLYFKTSSAYLLSKIRIPLNRVGTISGNATATIYEADVNHKPTGSALGSATLACSSIFSVSSGDKTNVINYVSFDFTTPVSLQGSKEYCIIVSCGGDSSNYLNIITSISNVYNDFARVYTNNGGSTWYVDSNYDPTFLAWGFLPTPAPNWILLTPLSDKSNIEIKAEYEAGSTGKDASYVQIQIASDSGFSNILEDTGQVAIDEISDGETYTRILNWFPSSEGTYYYRVAFWNSENYTATGNYKESSFIVGYPSIISQDVNNNNEFYTFTIQVSDSHTKPPVTTLNIGNSSYLMEYVERSGSGPYTYIFRKDVILEKGNLEYHYEIGNVWTTLIDDTRFLHVDYTLNSEPKIEIFSGNSKINSWNHLITDVSLPDYPSIEFDTDAELGYEIEVRLRRKTLQIYRMSIQRATKTPEGYHITAVEKAKEDLTQLISLSTQAKTSLTLVENILPNYIIEGSLPEVVYLQDFQDEQKINILRRLLILNNSIGYVRNKKLFIFDLSSQEALLRLSKNDPEVDFEIDYDAIINKVREYYVKKSYPVPANLLTNYDASNWTGTVSNQRQTSNGILAPSGSPYLLKGNGTIYRSVDFKWSDFDRLDLNWCPDTASSLEIRLEEDSSNYRKYTRTFAGSKGAGFVLTSSNPTDEVYKEVSFSSKYIHKISATVTVPCSIRYVLKLSGNTVADTGYMTIIDTKSVIFQNNLCDTILVYFTNLYAVGTTYGVQCTKLEIEEYMQKYVTTGISEGADWHGGYSSSVVGDRVGETTCFKGEVILGSAPYLASNQRFEIQNATCYIRYMVPNSFDEIKFYGTADITIENGSFKATFEVCTSGVPNVNLKARIYYQIDIFRMTPYETGEYIWVYDIYKWDETYNLFDNISVSFSQFTSVGSPTDQINTIRLIATGDNYYDNIYVYKSNPVAQYVDVENSESIKKGIRFQERKTDGWSSKESATAFATAFVNIFGNPAKSYSKKIPLKTDINIGDMVNCDGEILPIYKIVYDLSSGHMTIFVGRSVTDTIEFLKETSRKIEAIQKVLY